MQVRLVVGIGDLNSNQPDYCQRLGLLLFVHPNFLADRD
jgi:hypothetical protein